VTTCAPLVVVVDDDSLYLSLMVETLDEAGYVTLTDTRTTGAIARLGDATPALVILDLQIEEEDAGLTVLWGLRLHPRLENVPVLICSANAEYLYTHRADLAALGCTTLAKPFNLDAMLALVHDTMMHPPGVSCISS